MQTCIRPSGCHCHSLSLASVKPDRFYLSGTGSPGVVPGKGPLNVCSVVVVGAAAAATDTTTSTTTATAAADAE